MIVSMPDGQTIRAATPDGIFAALIDRLPDAGQGRPTVSQYAQTVRDRLHDLGHPTPVYDRAAEGAGPDGPAPATAAHALLCDLAEAGLVFIWY